MKTPRPIEVQARLKHRLWLRYDDGVEGEVDVADMAGHGVFKAWEDTSFFAAVCIAPHGALVWGEDIELCPDAMYLRLTGKTAEQAFPRVSEAEVDA